MTPALRLQGRVFCALSLGLVVACLNGARLDSRYELGVTGALILLLGVPHGAFDVVLARKLFGVADFKGWALFSLFYIGLSALVVGLWYVAPSLFLCVFLAFAALHFGVIVLPALWHGAELQRLLGLVAGPASAALVAPVLSQLAPVWLGATVLACALQARTARLAALEFAALAALAVTAPPLLTFTVYFCAMHSPRHILRTLASLRGADARNALALAIWPTAAVLAAAVLIGWLASGVPIETRVMQLVFVGLAALTLPHMVLLERLRRSGLPTEFRQWSVSRP